ncbi:MAG: hypothetical protein AABY22_14735 [Nanoarchaeota archaeon]
MKKNYQQKIINIIQPREWISFQDISKRLKLNSWGNTSTKYYRAWLDLIASGRLDESVDGSYRLNQ